jgi:hypothetical protein
MWIHLSFLTIATLITWLWTTTETLNFYTLQLIAVLIVLYFIKNLTSNKFNLSTDKKIIQYTDATILTLVILLLVFSTGGLASPLFFLIYFLLFGLSFLFEPKLAISFSFILLVFFAPGLSSSQEAIKLFSLVLVAPLALFFGQQYLQNLANENRIKIFKSKWLENEKSLENQETNALMWLSLNFKQNLAEIIENSANLLSQISSLSSHQQESVRKIKKNAEKLLAQGDQLKKIIDQETDEK